MAGEQLAQVSVSRGPVHHRERIEQRWQLKTAEHCGWNPVDDARAAGLVQRELYERSKPRLRHALGGRVDRCQDFLERRGVLLDAAILGVDDLEAERPAAHFAEAADARAAREIRLLRARKIEEAQRQG